MAHFRHAGGAAAPPGLSPAMNLIAAVFLKVFGNNLY
jgi:hypothetical protein